MCMEVLHLHAIAAFARMLVKSERGLFSRERRAWAGPGLIAAAPRESARARRLEAPARWSDRPPGSSIVPAGWRSVATHIAAAAAQGRVRERFGPGPNTRVRCSPGRWKDSAAERR